MKVINIIATRNTIEFITDIKSDQSVTVVCFSPAIGEKVETCRATVVSKDGIVAVDRYRVDNDLLYSKFELLDEEGNIAAGKCYVEDITYSERCFDYPVVDTKKGLQVTNVADAMALGVKHAALNVNQGDFLLLEPVEGNTIEFEFNGKKYQVMDIKSVKGFFIYDFS